MTTVLVATIRTKTKDMKKIADSTPHQIRSIIEFVIAKKMDDEKLEKQIQKLIDKGAVTMQSIEEAITHSLSIQNRKLVEFESIQQYWTAKETRNLGDCWAADKNTGLSGKVSAYEY